MITPAFHVETPSSSAGLMCRYWPARRGFWGADVPPVPPQRPACLPTMAAGRADGSWGCARGCGLRLSRCVQDGGGAWRWMMVPTVWFIAPSSFASLSCGIVTSATGAGQALCVPFRHLALQPWPRKHLVVVSSLHKPGVGCRRCQLRLQMSPSRPPTLKKGEMMAPRGWAHTTGVFAGGRLLRIQDAETRAGCVVCFARWM